MAAVDELHVQLDSPVEHAWAKMKRTWGGGENVTDDLSLQRLVHFACLTEDDWVDQCKHIPTLKERHSQNKDRYVECDSIVISFRPASSGSESSGPSSEI
jgi:hypothetical protein